MSASCNASFVCHHRARLLRYYGDKLDAYAIDVKVFSLLIQTHEDTVMFFSFNVLRSINKSAIGAQIYDSMAPELRGAGAFIYDGSILGETEGVEGGWCETEGVWNRGGHTVSHLIRPPGYETLGLLDYSVV